MSQSLSEDEAPNRSVVRGLDASSESEQENDYVGEVLDDTFPQEPDQSSQTRHPMFPNTIPADLPSQSPESLRGGNAGRWQIPDQYKTHWERVPEAIKFTPVSMQGYEAACMTPSPEHEGKMFSESKCFSLLPRSSLDLLAGPHEGITYCFVTQCLSEIPDMSLKVLYFFDMVRIFMQSQDRSPFVFPTDIIGLLVSQCFLSTPWSCAWY